MNLDAVESGKSASQIRGEMLIEMVSSSSREIELSVLASVENPKIRSYAEYIDLGRNSDSLLIWRNKVDLKVFIWKRVCELGHTGS